KLQNLGQAKPSNVGFQASQAVDEDNYLVTFSPKKNKVERLPPTSKHMQQSLSAFHVAKDSEKYKETKKKYDFDTFKERLSEEIALKQSSHL
ncbi:unnamed protein product, partial [Ilex paraguariensis]